MKARFLALAALVLGLASCQTDPSDLNVDWGVEQDAVVTVALPADATRAAGADSALGAIGNIDMSEYDIRFILAVYDGDELAKGPLYVYGDETTANFSLRLVPGRNYNFVAWADFVKEGTKVDLHYDTSDLANIQLIGEQNLNDESRDAYTTYEVINYNSSANISLTLTRPFAKLRVVTTDMNELYKDLVSATVEYTTQLYTSFNALNATAGNLEVVKKSVTYSDKTNYEGEPTADGKKTLFADYFFGTEDGKVLFTLDVADESYAMPQIVFNTNIPVQRNYLTTVMGPVLTDANKVTVTIDAKFEAPELEYYFEEDGNNSIATAVAVSADGLATIAEKINNGELEANTNIALAGDIDLSQLVLTRAEISNWVPVGTEEKPFTGAFDGRGYTIKNLTLVESEAKEGKAYIGFFGYAKNATIKNVTFENVYINIPCLDIDHSQGHIGAVAGSLEGTSTIENVTVKGDIEVYATQNANGASRVAVIAGGNSYGDVTMKNVHVIANEGSYLIANNNTGALAGQLQGKSVFENCTSNIDVTVNKFFAGGLIGIAAGDSYFKNCHTTGDVAVVAGREGRHNDEYRVGGIAGGWADGKTKVCTLENCSYTGKVSGKNADGSVANPLDYDGYVGRGYTLSNCAGSKVVIDGKEFIQKYDDQYGIYTINGCTAVSTADELVAALEANEGVYFLNDIKIDPANMSNAYGKTGINVKNGQTIDGNGHTLNIKGAGGTWDSGINTTGGLIKNITVTGSFRGIFINHTSTHSEKVVLENVTIGGNGTVYTISCDQGLYQTIEATNCTFNGWTSFAKDAGKAKFVNCNFGEGSGYKYCRPYSDTEFIECTFCPGYAVDESQAKVTFTNCTWEE